MSASLWNGPHSTTTTHLRTALTPYLTLPHLLSLTWLAAPILSLIFVAFRLLLSLDDAQNALEKTKVNLLASCLAAEQAATSTVSMPRYLALATNKQFAEAVNGSMEAARLALVLSLTVMEGVINFIIDIYRSTFLCLLELVVRGGLSILIGAVQELNQAVQSAAGGVRTGLQQQVSSANSIIQTAVDAINRVNPFDKITAPQITVNLDGLENVSLASSFQDSLVKLNETIPSSSDIKQKLQDILNTPFELVKKDINDTFLGLSFNPDGLPIPEQHGVSFCEKLDTSVVDDLGADLLRTVKIGIFLLLAVAVFLITMNCLLTWYRWRCLKNHFEYTRQAWMTDPTITHPDSQGSVPQITLSDHNLMLLGADSQNPFITRIMNQFSARFRLSPRQHIHARWFLQYIFHAPAIACFLIGFFGLLSIQLQLIAMRPLVNSYRHRAQNTVSDFNLLIAESINTSMQNQSATYATEVNSRAINIETTLNQGVFGWVNGTTITLNNTINAVYTDVQNAVTLVFGGSILETPAQQFVRCLIGSKVEAIENAITFLHDNLKVAMPRVNQNVLVLSPDSVNEATGPIAAAAIGGGKDDDQGFLGQVIQAYVDSLKKERLMFLIFIGLWVLVVLLGLLVVLWHSIRAPKDSEQKSGFSDNEKGGNVVKVSLDPFWSKKKSLPKERKESLLAKLLAALRKAFSRKPRTKKEKVQKPVKDTKPVKDIKPIFKERDCDWYDKMKSLLAKKEKSAPLPVEKPKPKPELKIVRTVTPKKESPPPRFSMTPKPPAAWKNLIAPPKKKQAPTILPLPLSKPPPPRVVVLDRGSPLPPRITSMTPLLAAEALAFPVPLHAGFDDLESDSNPTRMGAPSRPQSVTSVMSSPKLILYQTPFSPPPPPMIAQHLHPPLPPLPEIDRRSASFGAQTSATNPGWRVKNALPLESPPTTSVVSPNEPSKGGENAYDSLPIAKSSGTTESRNPAFNPFVTPFDDEFRSRTNEPNP